MGRRLILLAVFVLALNLLGACTEPNPTTNQSLWDTALWDQVDWQ